MRKTKRRRSDIETYHRAFFIFLFLTVSVALVCISYVKGLADGNLTSEAKIGVDPMALMLQSGQKIIDIRERRVYVDNEKLVHYIDNLGWDNVISFPTELDLPVPRSNSIYNFDVQLSPNGEFIFLVAKVGNDGEGWIFDIENSKWFKLSKSIGIRPWSWLHDDRLRIFYGCITSICEMYESVDSYKPWILEKKEFKEVSLGNISIPYPADWVLTESYFDEFDSLVFDPAGEGPNPYSTETGEGTNPFDDISVYYAKNTDSKERIKEIITGSGDVRNYSGISVGQVRGKDVYRYRIGGVDLSYGIIMILDDQRYLSIIAPENNESRNRAEDLLGSILLH